MPTADPVQCEHEYFDCPTQFKAVEGEENIVEGTASVFGNIDLGGDIVHPGAFTKTIKERVPSGQVKFMDTHIWNGEHTLGTVTKAFETKEALQFKAKVSSASSAQDIKVKMVEGHLSQTSFGFDVIRQDFEDIGGRIIRNLRELKLIEISVVPFPMNEATQIFSVKSAVPFQALPLAERDCDWDGAARKRFQDLATSNDEVNFVKFRRAFVCLDPSKPEDPDSYQLPIADVIDGKLVAVPKGILSAAAALCGTSIPEPQKSKARSHLAKYYPQMRSQFDDDSIMPPWEKSSNLDGLLYLAQYGLVTESSQIDDAIALLSPFKTADWLMLCSPPRLHEMNPRLNALTAEPDRAVPNAASRSIFVVATGPLACAMIPPPYSRSDARMEPPR